MPEPLLHTMPKPAAPPGPNTGSVAGWGEFIKQKRVLIASSTATFTLLLLLYAHSGSETGASMQQFVVNMGSSSKYSPPPTNKLLSIESNVTVYPFTSGDLISEWRNTQSHNKVYSLGRGKVLSIDEDDWHNSEPAYEHLKKEWTKKPERGPFVALIPGKDSNQGLGGSSILALPDGSVVLAFVSGNQRKPFIQVSVLGAFDPRNWEGTKWSQPHEVESIANHDPVYQSYRGMGSPTLLFDAVKGRVHLFFTAYDPARGLISAMPMRSESLDMGKTWDWPQMLFPGAKTQWGSAVLMYGEVVRSHPIVVSDGSWMVPMYHSPGGVEGAKVGKADEDREYSAVKFTTNEGATWRQFNITEPGMKLVDPAVIKLRKTSFFKSDKSLMVFLRDRAGKHLRFSVSVDEGKTWGKLSTMSLPNNNNGFAALSLVSGAIILVFENNNPGTCAPLSVALSDDGGWTWPFVRDIDRTDCHLEGLKGEPFVGARDPSASQGPDGAIHISYSQYLKGGKVKTKHGLSFGPPPISPGIKYVRVGENWIRAARANDGATTGAFVNGPGLF